MASERRRMLEVIGGSRRTSPGRHEVHANYLAQGEVVELAGQTLPILD